MLKKFMSKIFGGGVDPGTPLKYGRARRFNTNLLFTEEMWLLNTVVLSYSVVCKLFFNRSVHCFNSLPESVVSSKTVAEFKRRLSDVDLSLFLRYNFTNSIRYT